MESAEVKTSPKAKRTEFFQHKGTWCMLPIIVQGIFEDGECVAVKVLDGTDRTPISWAFNPKNIGGPKSSDLREGFRKILQRAYDERNLANEGCKTCTKRNADAAGV